MYTIYMSEFTGEGWATDIVLDFYSKKPKREREDSDAHLKYLNGRGQCLSAREGLVIMLILA